MSPCLSNHTQEPLIASSATLGSSNTKMVVTLLRSRSSGDALGILHCRKLEDN
ncbi:hypothetical protein DCAR_0726954 [Daucus carota subsp. sativus]|uniref:Uncharacterized protein n=1 Tax=Daucus carota subsp. sativus TaxID=79200 RepID=A0A161ZK62_DAUCS|nr:hypothetical protein DCAR_0726954 [Daucus carota subsp. sativus]